MSWLIKTKQERDGELDTGKYVTSVYEGIKGYSEIPWYWVLLAHPARGLLLVLPLPAALISRSRTNNRHTATQNNSESIWLIFNLFIQREKYFENIIWHLF